MHVACMLDSVKLYVEQVMPYVKAVEGKQPKSVLYTAEDGRKVVRSGGSRTWRNNNPGNMESRGGFASRLGAIGSAGGFAVFPDYATGRAAFSALLHGKRYIGLSIAKAIERYAPPEGNDTAGYIRLVARFSGLSTDRKLADLTPVEFESLLDAMERVEGWKVGTEQAVKRIVGALTDGQQLTAFLIEGGSGYLSKSDAVRLAVHQEIDAIVVYRSRGEAYLRATPDQFVGNNLRAMAERV